MGQQRGNVPIGAWGGYTYGRRTSEHVRKPYIQVGWYGFSGDDPRTTGRIEGWDPLFSRWPKWSELYIYSQMRETGVGYWTNSSMWQGEAGFSPQKTFSSGGQPIGWTPSIPTRRAIPALTAAARRAV